MWISSPCACCRSAAYLARLVAVSIMDAGVSATSFYEVTIAPVTENASISQGRGVHVTGVSAAYTFKLNKNILSE
jgi:hypothetical protein